MQTRWIGIDLHKTSFTVAVKTQDGKIEVLTFSFDSKGIEDFKKLLTISDYVAIEASSPSFFLYDQISELVKKCVIVNSKKFKVVSESTSKTDKKDAKLLAKYLSYEDLLPEVYVPNDNIKRLRSYFSMYSLTNKQLVQTKNRIHSLILTNGIELSESILFDKKHRTAVLTIDMDKEYKFLLEQLYKKLDFLLEEKKALTYKIICFEKIFEKEVNILTSISGISYLIALALISDIADINRFGSAKNLCSYLGVVPKVDSSGNTAHNGKCHKNSRKLSRTLLTQVVRHLCNNSEELNLFYQRKRKSKGAGKARVAIIKKTITMIYYMLQKKEYCYYRVEKKHNRKIRDYELFCKNYEKNIQKRA